MKNILQEKPTDKLLGRLAASMSFVDDYNIKDKKVLDIGCGYGWCELNFLDRGASELVGMELTESDLVTIRENINDTRLTLVTGSAIEIPLTAQSVDTVVSWEVIEHIPKNTEAKMFSEVFRVLKPGGVFYLSTPHASFWARFFDPAWWLIGHRHYKETKLRNLAESAGFVTDQCVRKGGWWEIVGLLNMYIAKWIFRRRPFFEYFVLHRQDQEFKHKSGFTNIFFKFVKE